MRITRSGKTAIIVVAGAGIASTPLYWVLGSPDTGQLVAASVQGATGILALVWAVLTTPAPAQAAARDAVIGTGAARATGGGRASTGVRRPRGAGGGTARAERTGDATAEGRGSSASSGVDYS